MITAFIIGAMFGAAIGFITAALLASRGREP